MSSKRAGSPSIGHPATKRQHINFNGSKRRLSFDSLADELVLVIFSYLAAVDLCRAESVNRSWRRLAKDDELWKALFLQVFGGLRLRGGRFGSDLLSRPIIPLRSQHEAPILPSPHADRWKELYRIGSNWKTGKCVTTSIRSLADDRQARPLLLLLGRGGSIISDGKLGVPSVKILSTHKQISLTSSKSTGDAPIRVSSFALNQDVWASSVFLLAIFYSTETKFHHLSIFQIQTGMKSSHEDQVISPRLPRSPIVHSAYHSSFLIALSETFQLDIYHCSGGKSSQLMLIRSMSSFTSFQPSSLTISRPSSTSHKVLLSYAVPVYPSHWSAAATQLQLDDTGDIYDTRTLRILQQGWETQTDEDYSDRGKGSKMPAVGSIQTDGRFLVVAPRNENYMELYRLRTNFLSFVRVLFGPSSPICAIAVADARAVTVSLDGNIWIHELERGWSIEVRKLATQVSGNDTCIYFDDRRIVVSTPSFIETISFE
ncbi:hypothetical protein FRC14_000121 [Serendipita sp. 396]|nr:hypothetical protein FRC14_000121 [Serendipita sp. 396]KAG8789134.1 hypothetical protein FRC15_011702 [Serendipita sp. 397]KAG8804173.1 hypothetical protein FRC16_000113 [Serendipita sp. 398]KAG8827192.1 hypothetical protein FRC19_005010 [Serendipita sp. 401]